MPEGRTETAFADGGMRALSWRQELALFFLTTLFLTWPLAINGTPFYTGDSASYLRGGGFGLSTVLQATDQWWNSLFGPSQAALAGGDLKSIVAEAVAESRGVRSIIYSVTTYLLRWPDQTLIALAIFQAAVVALIVSFIRSNMAPRAGFGASLAAGAAIALLTTAAWYAAYAMPDIFAGIAIGGAAALTLFFDRIGRGARVTLVLLIAYSITVHGSHLPIALSVLLAGAVARFLLQKPQHRDSAVQPLWFLGPVVLGVAVLLGTSYAAFGEASLAPKRYPIQLARSVADGPGAWHLRDHCATERYAICEIFGPAPPRKVGEFLWSRNGVRYRATPEQMDRIRAEEGIIVRRAAMEYPVEQVRRSATNIVRQLVVFGPDDLVFGERLVGRDDPSLTTVHTDRLWLKGTIELIVYLSFAVCILLLFTIRRRLRPLEIAAIAMVTTGLLANAALCGILSAVTDRYQGRVAWLLPALTIFIILRIRSESELATRPAKAALA